MSYYVLNISLETTFARPPYGFSSLVVGLMYVPAALGYVLAGVLGGRWTDRVRRRAAARRAQAREGEPDAARPQPQDVIGANAWLAAATYPAALLAYGWLAEKHVLWIAPCLATFFYGAGNMMAFNVSTIMLSELIRDRPSTGVALNNLVRNTLACGAAIVAGPLMDAIGNGWLFTAVAVICWASAVALLLLLRNGEAWGARGAVEPKG
ncbi:Major facilitator superfamily domain general substrate transporter [Macrophomina phaseolina MS6]|uniref:Major facilitator superfamily domain general substrate transporter n=2 Tax=Macrophomina phaseolina TaxID=35725 RepID=K2RYS9_MACPH|nr:Major facilitator superfamily domain general substrate transporter [Macrophomina phaseolina MS6]